MRLVLATGLVLRQLGLARIAELRSAPLRADVDDSDRLAALAAGPAFQTHAYAFDGIVTAFAFNERLQVDSGDPPARFTHGVKSESVDQIL